jgi:hypothetical protein
MNGSIICLKADPPTQCSGDESRLDTDSLPQEDINRLVSILWDIYVKLDPSERGFYTLRPRTQ